MRRTTGVYAVDTNVLIRLLTGDDPAQAAVSAALFAKAQIRIPTTVLLETEWVLRAAYRLQPADVCRALRGVCGLPNVTVQEPERIAQAITWHEQGMDFADALHLSHSTDLTGFKSFDAKLIKLAGQLAEIQVEPP